jgi:TatD DNase family protein
MYPETNSLPKQPTFRLVDIGINLMSPAFDHDRETVLANALDAGVNTLIITGSSIESSTEAATYAASHMGPAKLHTTAGVHPHNAKTWDAAAQAALLKLVSVSTPYVIAAIGECGLDYNRNFSPPEAQRKCFEDQLMLATQLGKPVFLHTRDAYDDFLSILKQYRESLPGVVIHCFTGEVTELESYLDLDCYIGITGWVTDERKGSHLIPLLRQIPSNRLLIETDAPYLLPRNLKGKGQHTAGRKSGRNEPRFLPHIAAYVAEILEKTPDQLAAETSANAARLFNFTLY